MQEDQPEDRKESIPRYRTIRLPQARDGVRHAGAYVLDAAEEYRPAVTWVFSWRRKLGTVVASVLAGWILFHVLLGANGTVAYGNKRTEYKTLEKDVDQLQTENDQLRKHIEALKGDPAAIEREAREQLDYVKPGGMVYVAPAPPPPPMPKNKAASNNGLKK